MAKQILHRIFKFAVVAGFMATSNFSRGGEQYPPTRYQVIISRAPFGREPERDEETPQEVPTIDAEQAAKDLRLSMLIKSNKGNNARAGLVNTTDNKSFIISIGETINNIKLIEVDIENENATLQRNGVTLLLKLAKGVKKTVAPSTHRTPAASRRSRVIQSRRRQLQQQDEEVKAQPTEEERAAVQQRLRDYQMEVIRKGMPPLPIQLTPEMDAQLVEEGVLPPNEGM